MYDKLTQIDDITRPDHYFITANDNCYFLGEYTARVGYSYSDTNQLIVNLKIGVGELKRIRHKNIAITAVANHLLKLIDVSRVTFVPVPPSKCKQDPEYDDRLIRILRTVKQANPNADYRELILQKESTIASHLSEERTSIEDLINLYDVDLSVSHNMRPEIIIFDDMLTTGRHYKAMQSVILDHFPDSNIYGLFVARRVPNSADLAALFDDLE